MDPQQLKDLIITPTLQALDLFSVSAVNLILGTAAQESQFKYIRQLGGGPALGIYQMEPATHDDVWDNYLAYRTELAGKLRALASQKLFYDHAADEMIGNIYYATAMCRVHYLRVTDPLPATDDIVAMGNYWKLHYNTPQGNGTAREFVDHFPMDTLNV